MLSALFVVKRLLACGVLASACSLNPQGEDPGLVGGPNAQTASDEMGTFTPGGDDGSGALVDSDGTVIAPQPNQGTAGPAATGPTGASIDDPAAPLNGAPSPSEAPAPGTLPPVAAGGAPNDDGAASGGSPAEEEPSPAGAAGSGGAEGAEFDGGTFNYGSMERDAGTGDAGAEDAGSPRDGGVEP